MERTMERICVLYGGAWVGVGCPSHLSALFGDVLDLYDDVSVLSRDV